MPFIRILPFLLCFTSIAQVNIIIEDESKTGFLLGVNGYTQNTEPVHALVIKGLDTVPTQLLVELQPKAYFTKMIDLHEKGNYKYVITTNSRDELQLRYRGTLPSIPDGILAMNVRHSVLMEPKEPIVTASVKSDDLKIDSKPAFTAIAPIIDTKEIVQTKKVDSLVTAKPTKLTVKNDSTSIKPATELAPLTSSKDTIEPIAKSFDLFIADLSQTEFEFEKLQKSEDFANDHQLTLEELSQVLNILTYDNSRLQLIRSVKASFKDISEMKGLAEQLDYEISKQQLEEILKS